VVQNATALTTLLTLNLNTIELVVLQNVQELSGQPGFQNKLAVPDQLVVFVFKYIVFNLIYSVLSILN
jgi:hypothetical protein